MSSKRSRKQRRAEERARGGSQNPRARDDEKKILQEVGAPNQDKSGDGHARLRARAREEIPPGSSKTDVVVWIAKLHDEGVWVKGETPGVLDGAIIGTRGEPLSADTIENYSAEAHRIRQVVANKEQLAKVVFAETLSQLDRCRKDRELVDEVVSNWRDEESKKIHLTPMDLKMASDAMGRCIDSSERILDKLARFAGLIQSGSKLELKIQIGGDKVAVDPTELVALVQALDAFCDGVDAEVRALEANGIPSDVAWRAAELLLGRMRRAVFGGPGGPEEAPALPAAGA